VVFVPARDAALRAASTRAAALARHRPPDDPALAEARRELRRAQLEADARRSAHRFVAAIEQLDALRASGQTDRDGAS
jgi:hypothetical protein